jgi:hypothetical protein
MLALLFAQYGCAGTGSTIVSIIIVIVAENEEH